MSDEPNSDAVDILSELENDAKNTARPEKIPKVAGSPITAKGINNISFSGFTKNGYTNQYILQKKWPKPKLQPQKNLIFKLLS